MTETLLKKLIPNSQVFQQDPEKWSKEELADAIERITSLVTKHRAARGLSMEAVAAEGVKATRKRAPAKAKGSTASTKRGAVAKDNDGDKAEGLLEQPPFE